MMTVHRLAAGVSLKGGRSRPRKTWQAGAGAGGAAVGGAGAV